MGTPIGTEWKLGIKIGERKEIRELKKAPYFFDELK